MWLYVNILLHISYPIAGYQELLIKNQAISNALKRMGNLKIHKDMFKKYQIYIGFKVVKITHS